MILSNLRPVLVAFSLSLHLLQGGPMEWFIAKLKEQSANNIFPLNHRN